MPRQGWPNALYVIMFASNFRLKQKKKKKITMKKPKRNKRRKEVLDAIEEFENSNTFTVIISFYVERNQLMTSNAPYTIKLYIERYVNRIVKDAF